MYRKNGFPDDVTTYGLTSGIWFSALSLGSFIGPLLAGIMYDYAGFRIGSLICTVEHFTMVGEILKCHKTEKNIHF